MKRDRVTVVSVLGGKVSDFDTKGQFHQLVNMQLLLKQIPKAQKDSQVINDFLRFWDLRS